MEDIERLINEFDDIPWFAHVGEPLLDEQVMPVSSWQDAWEAHQDESNTNASFHNDIDQSHPIWEKAYDRAYAAVEHSGRNRELTPGNPVARAAAWDAAGAAYQHAQGSTTGHYIVLLNWYRRGHWPCGWSGDYPEGKLVVF